MKSPEFSVVVPVYNSADYLKRLAEEVSHTFTTLNKTFELIFVNDRSPDSSLLLLEEIKKNTPDSMVIIDLKKNIGQYAATLLGIHMTKGEYVITMDADFFPIETNFKNLIGNISHDDDLIYGELENVHAGSFRKSGSFLFNWLVKFSLNKKVRGNGSSFRLISKNLLERVLTGMYEPMMLDIYIINTAARVKFIPIHVDFPGTSSYSFFKLLSPGINLFMGILLDVPSFRKEFIPQNFIKQIK